MWFQRRSSDDAGISAEDLRFLHAEIGRLRAALVAVTATQRMLLGRSAYSARRTISDLVSQRLEARLRAAFPGRSLRADPAHLASRLLWFELVTGSHVRADAEAFSIWVWTTLALGPDSRLLIAGPASDTAAEAVAEARAGFGKAVSAVVSASDADPSSRVGRRALDGHATLIRSETLTGSGAGAGIVYGADHLSSLQQIVVGAFPPSTIVVTSDDIRHDDHHVDKLLVAAPGYEVALAWGSTTVLING